MYLVVGLGNPGKEYEKTRHNIGFMVVRTVAQGMEITKQWQEGDAWLQSGEYDGSEIVLAQPLTYMNDSGKAVARLFHQFTLDYPELLVIGDEVQLPLGTIRLRRQGSDGGHNGLASIIQHLGTEGFPRLRLGIGPTNPPEGLIDFVLEPFDKQEEKTVRTMTEQGAQAVFSFIRYGLEHTMNVFNSNINN